VHVVNNGAAALALVTSVLARGREVVVARGELVEIGDGFRIPELLESVGATLREVGTTNRVRLADYAAAVGERSAFVLKVHPSNFRVEGFTSSVSVASLAALDVPLVADIGSGLLAPHPRLPDEPDAATYLREGATLVTASGDKLLGGPQCGLLLGDADLVQRLRRDPFARALRVDKLTLAALEATLTGPATPVSTSLATRPEDLFAARSGWRRRSASPPMRSRRPRPSAAAEHPVWRCRAQAVALPAGLAAALRRGLRAGGRPCRGRAAAARPDRGPRGVRRRGRGRGPDRAGPGRHLTCTSSRPPVMSTTASPPWCGR
jgi:L-seryl-tRNA(Ser) seleniumtransferase